MHAIGSATLIRVSTRLSNERTPKVRDIVLGSGRRGDLATQKAFAIVNFYRLNVAS